MAKHPDCSACLCGVIDRCLLWMVAAFFPSIILKSVVPLVPEAKKWRNALRIFSLRGKSIGASLWVGLAAEALERQQKLFQVERFHQICGCTA